MRTLEARSVTSMTVDLSTIKVAEAATTDVVATATVAKSMEATEKVPVYSVEVVVALTARTPKHTHTHQIQYPPKPIIGVNLSPTQYYIKNCYNPHQIPS